VDAYIFLLYSIFLLCILGGFDAFKNTDGQNDTQADLFSKITERNSAEKRHCKGTEINFSHDSYS
jgi:hypothetical protein